MAANPPIVKPWPDNNLLVSIARQCGEDSKKWFPSVNESMLDSLVHMSLALAGEVGEVANIVKKCQRGDKDIATEVVKAALNSEVADVFTYLMNVANLLQIDLLKEYVKKREFNDRRFNPRRNGNVTA